MAVEESLDHDVWVARCVAHMVELDPKLDPELARPVADDMCSRPRWRSMSPEEAATAVFEFGKKPRQ
ncbi:MAG: hypothetical protein H7Y61_00025 [Rhizobiales bacterium]|nr:hypothetical protein [Rhizobacter sp.]